MTWVKSPFVENKLRAMSLLCAPERAERLSAAQSNVPAFLPALHSRAGGSFYGAESLNISSRADPPVFKVSISEPPTLGRWGQAGMFIKWLADLYTIALRAKSNGLLLLLYYCPSYPGMNRAPSWESLCLWCPRWCLILYVSWGQVYPGSMYRMVISDQTNKKYLGKLLGTVEHKGLYFCTGL